jgi:CRP-like cAMP-binding protein
MVSEITDFTQLPSAKLYFSVGETILNEGDITNGWFVLLSGKVGVFKRDFSITEITKPGTVIGELGFLLNIPRTATLIAHEPTMLLHVRVRLDELITNYPQLAKKMMLMLAERLVKTTEDWRESVSRVETY